MGLVAAGVGVVGGSREGRPNSPFGVDSHSELGRGGEGEEEAVGAEVTRGNRLAVVLVASGWEPSRGEEWTSREGSVKVEVEEGGCVGSEENYEDRPSTVGRSKAALDEAGRTVQAEAEAVGTAAAAVAGAVFVEPADARPAAADGPWPS